MGFGRSRKTTIQQAAPASMGTQVVSMSPVLLSTRASALLAPPQAGRSRSATMNLAHFGTAHFENRRAPCKDQNEMTGTFMARFKRGGKWLRTEKVRKVLRPMRDALYFAPLNRGVEQPGS